MARTRMVGITIRLASSLKSEPTSLSDKNILKPRDYFYDEANGTTDYLGIEFTGGFLVLNSPISF